MMEERAVTIEACKELTEDMCRGVINNNTAGFEDVSRRNVVRIEFPSPAWSQIPIEVSIFRH
jgi:hypothetical protein